MRLFFKTNLYVAIVAIIALSSCDTNEINQIKFDKAEISMQVGQLDSLTATISYTGELSQFPHEWTIADPTIYSITEKTTNKTAEGTSFEKTVIIKALKPGTSTLSINIGGKTLSCQIKVDQRAFNFNQAYASNWGDYYETETNNYSIYLFEKTLSWNSEGEIQGNGNMIYLEFFTPLTQNTLTSGNYIMSDNGDINTFLAGEIIEQEGETYLVGTKLVNYNGKNSTTSIIKDGEFTIVKSGGGFVIEGEFILENDESIQFSYANGIFEEGDERNPIDIHPTLTKGLLVYYGDAYDTKTNNFNLYLYSETVVSEDSVRIDDVLVLEHNTATTAKDYIPNGTYNMMSELSVKAFTPYSLVFGYVDKDGNQWGCWYDGDTEKKLKTGSFNSQKSGEIYTINYELYDRFNSKVWGTFNGELEYADGTVENAASAPAYIKGNKKKATPATKKMPAKSKKLIKKKPLKH